MVASLYEYFDTGRCVALEGLMAHTIFLETESCKARRYFCSNWMPSKGINLLFEKISETNHYLAEIEENTQQTAGRMKLQNIQTADLEIQIRELQRQSKIGNYCAEQTRRELITETA